MRLALDVLRKGTTGGLRAGAGDDHGRLGARLRGEAVFEQVLCPLGLDPGHGEVVLEATSGGYGAADEAGDREEHEERDAAGSASGEGGEVGEHEDTFARLSRIFNLV